MTPLKQIADTLTKAQREALLLLPDEWGAGPLLPDAVIDAMPAFRESHLVDRRFGDAYPPEYRGGDSTLTVRLQACWFFRVSELGLELRRYLQDQDNAHT